jgi:hypothetical protein
MRLDDEAQTMPPAARTAGQEILVALIWIVAGAVTLLALCLLGPMIVAYATSAGLPITVLAPLVSSIIAGWDVGGLLLMMLGIRRLILAYRSRDGG